MHAAAMVVCRPGLQLPQPSFRVLSRTHWWRSQSWGPPTSSTGLLLPFHSLDRSRSVVSRANFSNTGKAPRFIQSPHQFLSRLPFRFKSAKHKDSAARMSTGKIAQYDGARVRHEVMHLSTWLDLPRFPWLPRPNLARGKDIWVDMWVFQLLS